MSNKSDKPDKSKDASSKTQQSKNPQPMVKVTAPKAKAGGPASKLSISVNHALLMVVLVLIGFSIYLWTQIQQVRVDQANVLVKAKDEVSQLERIFQQYKSDSLSAKNDTRGQLTKMAQSIAELRRITGREKQGWKLAEAGFLLAAANHSIKFNQDQKTALYAMREADQRLKEMNDPSLVEARKKLAIEITQLQAVRLPDISGMALKLDSLSQQAKDYPIKGALPEPRKTSTENGNGDAKEGESHAGKTQSSVTAATGEDKKAKKKTFSEALDAVWGKVKALVVVHHYSESVSTLLSSEQKLAIQQVLELKLLRARLSLLKADPVHFKNALKSTTDWINKHFDIHNSKVKNALLDLDDLGKKNIVVDWPDISVSLRQIRSQEQNKDKLGASSL